MTDGGALRPKKGPRRRLQPSRGMADAQVVFHVVHPRLHPACFQPEQPKPKRDPRPERGWVYYVDAGTHYKIGYASDVQSRMKAYPPGCRLLAQHRGTKADERALHKRFSIHLDAGREWFRKDPEITAYIDAARQAQGALTALTQESGKARPWESGRAFRMSGLPW